MRRFVEDPLSVLILAFFALFPIPASAQSGLVPLSPAKAGPPATEAPKEAAIPAPARPKPVPIPAVTRESENARLRLQALREALTPGKNITRIQSDLKGREDEVERLFREFQAVPPADLAPADLENLNQTWVRLDKETGDWEDVLESAARTAEGDRAEIRAMAELWTSTLEAATEANAPAVVIDRIGAVLSGAGETDRLFEEQLGRLLVLQDRVARLRTRISDALGGIRKATLAAEQMLFEIESVPLWTAIISPQRSAPLAAELRESWRRAVRDLRYFMRQESGRLQIAVLFFVALAAAIVVLRKRGGRWLATADPSASAAKIILNRPVASSLLISIIFTLWICVAPPASFNHLLAIIALVPFFRLLPGLVRPSLHPPLYGIAVLWFVGRLRDLAVAHSLLQRLLLLAVGALGLAGLIWSLKPRGPARAVEAGTWWKATLLGAYAAAALLAISIICNVVGNVTLAERLTRATLGSAFVAVMLYAAVAIIEGMVAVALQPHAPGHRPTVGERSATVLRRWKSVIRAIAAIVWIAMMLQTFHVLGPAIDWTRRALAKRWVFGSIDISLGDVVTFAVAVVIAIVAAKVVRTLLDDAVLPGIDLPRGVPAAISKTAQYAVVVVGIVVASMAAGLEMTRFTFLAGALGVGIGFGLQNVVNNFVSGIILIYERPIQEGDVIEVGKVMGRVRRIGIRSSAVRTFDGAEVVLPNASLLSSEVVNWTLSDRACRAELKIGVAYGSDPRRVIRILEGVVRDRADVLSQPAAVVLFTGLGSSSLDFSLRFWAPDYDSLLQAKSAVLADAYAALGGAGIEIPFPQQDLHLKSVDPTAAKVLGGKGSDEG